MVGTAPILPTISSKSFSDHPGYTLNERLGLARKTPAGNICFDLEATNDYKLDICPPGGVPESFWDIYSQRTYSPSRTIRLGDSAFLTTYVEVSEATEM